MEKNSEDKYVLTRATTWKTMTDSGLYEVTDDKLGVMRFSFKVTPLGNIKEVGIKYVKGSGITDPVKDDKTVVREGALKVFYGDVTQISPDDTSKYYAVAYIITDENANPTWSNVVECTLDTNKLFTNYGGNE